VNKKLIFSAILMLISLTAVFAETNIETIPFPLESNEKIVDLQGNLSNFAAVIELTKTGIVKKTEYWIVTKDQRSGPFAKKPYVIGNVNEPFAFIEKDGKSYLHYGFNVDGTTMGTLAEVENLHYRISQDYSHWAVRTNSVQNPGKYDIVTNEGIFDWFTDPYLRGFTYDNKLIIDAIKKKSNPEKYSITLYREKEKLLSFADLSKDDLLKVYNNMIWLSDDGATFGWPIKLSTNGDNTAQYTVQTLTNNKTISLGAAEYVVHITPDGQVLHQSREADPGSTYYEYNNLYIDGIDTGVKQYLNIKFGLSPNKKGFKIGDYYNVVSPNGMRVALTTGEGIFVDGEPIYSESNIATLKVSCHFSLDSKNFIVQKHVMGSGVTIPPSINGKQIELPGGATSLQNGRFGFRVGPINLKNLQYVIYDDYSYYAKGELVGTANGIVGLDSEGYTSGRIDPRISNDGSTVIYFDKERFIYFNEKRASIVSEAMVFKAMSPDGSELLFYISEAANNPDNETYLPIVSLDGQFVGSFFGNDLNDPEGSIKFRDGEIIRTTWSD